MTLEKKVKDSTGREIIRFNDIEEEELDAWRWNCI